MKTVARLVVGSMLLVSTLLAHADGAPHLLLYVTQTFAGG